MEQSYVLDTLKALTAIDSPSGFTRKAVEYVVAEIEKMGYKPHVTAKGCIEATVRGKSSDKKVGLTGHIDTLGAMVRSITPDGRLKFTKIGGALLSTVEGEYCRIYTRDGKIYTGTFMSESPSVHVYDDAHTRKRDEENMWVRIDEKVHTRDDVLKLGINSGDFIAFDPRTVITETGFVKSRFLDDKASAACLLSVMKDFADNKSQPAFDTVFCFTVYEEVGHGGAALADVDEILAVDMGCIGKDLNCTEYDVSICAKDSGGPYDYEMTSRLIQYAKETGINYAVDIYPYYGSDVGAYIRAGHDAKGALIGPGVQASHGTERTTVSALNDTVRLIKRFLEN